MRHHTVSYIIKSFLDRKILKPYVLTNPHVIGLTDYCIFFNYIGGEKGARKKIIDFCVRSQQVAYFAELSGPYQYTVSLFCKTIFEVTGFFDLLSLLLPESSFERSFALRLRFTQFVGRFGNLNKKPIVLDRTKALKEIEISETDKKIVGFYSQNAELSLEKVGLFAGVSETTVKNRLTDLEKKGLIISYPYFLDTNRIGMTTYRIIFSVNGMNSHFLKKLYAYVLKHPNASAFVHCIGAWDFELNFDLAEKTEMGAIIEDLIDNFGKNIRQFHTVSEIVSHRAHHFPIDAGKFISN